MTRQMLSEPLPASVLFSLLSVSAWLEVFMSDLDSEAAVSVLLFWCDRSHLVAINQRSTLLSNILGLLSMLNLPQLSINVLQTRPILPEQ